MVCVYKNIPRCSSPYVPTLLSLALITSHYIPCLASPREPLEHWLRTPAVMRSSQVRFPLPPWRCVQFPLRVSGVYPNTAPPDGTDKRSVASQLVCY